MMEPRLPKSEWGPGPWQDEPDRLEWRCCGLPCLIVRNLHITGSLCGYVGVPLGHPLYGIGYDDEAMPDFDVHGGLTYSRECSPDGLICHVPQDSEPAEVYWFGFDCGHAGDRSPMLEATTRWAFRQLGREQEWECNHLGVHDEYEVYRDIEYVRAEVEKLAAQIKSAG